MARRLPSTGFFLSLFVIALALWFIASGWQETWAAISDIGTARLLLLCSFPALHYCLRALRWHIFVRTAGIGTVALQNARHFFGGFAMTATPGRIGELVRLRWLSRETGVGFGRLLPIVLADRAVELASMVFLIAAALTATQIGTRYVWWLVAIAAVLVWIACRPKMLELIVTSVWRLLGRRRPRLFVSLRRLTRRLVPFMAAGILVPTFLIGVAGWALEGLAFWWLMGWLGAPLDVATATAIFLTAILSGALSGLPGGFGGTEATAVGLLLLQGVPVDIAVLATALIRIATLWFAVAIGLAIFPLAEMRSART